MTIEEDRKAEANHHTRWAEEIRKRNEKYQNETDWFPFRSERGGYLSPY